jgi:hypothetical protein
VGTLSHQNKILAENKIFQLVKRKKHDDRGWYEVKCNAWTVNDSHILEIRDFFDPKRNKSGTFGTTWKYRNRKDAEQMFLTATLRWA